MTDAATEPRADDSPLTRVDRGRAGAWALYDLANTVYAASLTFLFTPWFADKFEDRSALGVTQTLSMILAGLMVPALGAIADRTGLSRGYLSVSTILCIAAMASWSFLDSAFAVLAGLFVANLCYQTALVFYNTLLASVAPPQRAGLVNGIGVGVGYLGTIVVVVLFMFLFPVPEEDLDGRQDRFILVAGLFLVTALPCMAWVRERRRIARTGDSDALIRSSLRGLGRTLRELPRHPALMYFLLGNFFLVDVLNTAILWFADYTGSVFEEALATGRLSVLGMTFDDPKDMEGFIGVLALSLNLLALTFGIVFAVVTDRAPLRVMRLAGVFLGVGLIGGAVFGGESATGYLLTLVLCGAIGLSGIWTAGRKIVVMLAPPDKVGEFFGLYGITVKVSVLGSAVFGVVADRVSMKAAILVQGVQLTLGLIFLWRVRLEKTS